MMDKRVEAMLNGPLNNALKLNVPGTRKAPRGPRSKVTSDFDANRITRAELDRRKQNSASGKLVAVLDYYATTTVPFERIAEHTKLSLDEAKEAMNRRGRVE